MMISLTMLTLDREHLQCSVEEIAVVDCFRVIGIIIVNILCLNVSMIKI